MPLCVPLWPAFDLGGRACLSHSHRSCGKTLCLGASAAPTRCPPAQPSPSSCPVGWPSSLLVPGGQACGFQGDHLLPWPRARREPGAGLPHGGGRCPLLRAPSLGPKGGEGQVNPAVCPSSLERRKRERSGSDVPVSEGARPASSSRSVSQAPQASFLGTHKRALEHGSDGGPSCLPSAQLLAGRDKALLFEGRHQFRFFLCHCSPVVPVTFSRLEALPS